MRAWGSRGEPQVPVEKGLPSAWRAAAQQAAEDRIFKTWVYLKEWLSAPLCPKPLGPNMAV